MKNWIVGELNPNPILREQGDMIYTNQRNGHEARCTRKTLILVGNKAMLDGKNWKGV